MIKNIFRKFLVFILVIIILSSVSASAVGFFPTPENFVYTDSYVPGQFSDVSEADWFSSYVREATNFGLIFGMGDGSFDPYGLLTIGQAVALAARLSSIYTTGTLSFEPSVPFYAVYVSYALEHGIIHSHSDYTAPVTRAQFAKMIYNALPTDVFEIINEIPPFGINDVSYQTDTDKAVYSLFRAGILTGSDRFGTFSGGSNLLRAEAAAIMVRLASPASRVQFHLPSQIPAEELFSRSSDAIFRIEIFGSNLGYIRSGSGFFISADGLAITALHVIEGSSFGSVELANGQVFRIAGVRAFCIYNNLAIIEIGSDYSDFSYLTIADSDLVETGNTVYAIGSPRGMMNSITKGIISHTSRMQDGIYMLQFSAPISFGSGGGPVINSLGQVIGVASSVMTYGQNMNLAIPSNLILALEQGELISLEEHRQSLLYQ